MGCDKRTSALLYGTALKDVPLHGTALWGYGALGRAMIGIRPDTQAASRMREAEGAVLSASLQVGL